MKVLCNLIDMKQTCSCIATFTFFLKGFLCINSVEKYLCADKSLESHIVLHLVQT